MIINPYIYSVGTAYDPDAQLFFNAQTAAGVTLTTTQMNAVNQWVVDSKAAGIWTKMKAVYPMVGGSPTSHKFNLKNPLDTDAAFRLSFVGGGTHSANGYLPNGINAYANTFLNSSTNLSLNSGHLSYYSRSNNVSAAVKIDMGSLKTGPDSYTDLVLGSSNLIYFRFNNTTTYDSTPATNTLGYFIGSRTASSVIKTFKDRVLIINGTALSNTTSLVNFYIGASNNNGTAQYFSNNQCAFATIGDGLTDLESQLLYQITEKYKVALSRNVNTTQSFYYNSAYNNETNAFLFSTQITDNTIQTATNTLVTDLKTAGVFTKMKAIYPMVGGTATTCKFNLVNPQDTDAAYRLVFSGGGTFSANGYQPNGTNAYADTFINSLTNLTATSTHLSYYSRTATVGVAIEMGSNDNATGLYYLSLRTAANFMAGSTAVMVPFTSTTNAQGFWVGSKRSNSDREVYKNGTSETTSTVSDTGAYVNCKIFLGAVSTLNTPRLYSNKECAFASIGDGLTDAEALALYNAVQLFNTTLARQV
jgi:hypothetical protein